MSFANRMTRLVTGAHVGVYRLTRGKVGSSMAKLDLALLTTTGRKSGQARTTPLAWFPYGGDAVVIASANGSDSNPAWYLNLQANPEVTLQRGADSVAMTARTATPAEKAQIWAEVVARAKNFEGYQAKTSRDIPVVILSAH